MFSTVSMTGTGLAVLLLTLALGGLDKFLGIHISLAPEQVQSFVDNAAQIISLAMMVIGQLRRPDLVGGIIRK